MALIENYRYVNMSKNACRKCNCFDGCKDIILGQQIQEWM